MCDADYEVDRLIADAQSGGSEFIREEARQDKLLHLTNRFRE